MPPAEVSPLPRSAQARWWQWAAAEPEPTNPVADRTGEHCQRNQPGDVWFLAGTFGGLAQRRCTVPSGVPLIVPAINRVADEDGCRDYMAAATGTIRWDGTEVPLQRIGPEPIAFTAGPGNPVTGHPGKTTGLACGLWARIDAPGEGEHKVRIQGRSGSFALDVEYTLTIAAPARTA